MNTESSSRGFPTVGTVLAGLALVMVAIGGCFCVKVRTIPGNQIAVLEDSKGVSNDPVHAGTYYYLFSPFTEVYPYPLSGQVFVMNDKSAENEPFAHGRKFDPLVVNSLDNQQVTFHLSITWRIDPLHVVNLHKNYRDNIEERLIRPEVVNEVSTRATLKNAIDLYSGQTFNDLREQLTTELRSPQGKLATSGVIVDKVVIDRPRLSPEYEALIEKRQLAIATESQAREQLKANQAIANAAKTAALKQQYEEVVDAQTKAQKTVIDQQAASDKATIAAKANAANSIVTQEAAARIVVINAKAEADRQVAISEAAKQAEVNRAVGIKAVGAASADANKLLLASYSVPGSDNYTRIQVSNSMAAAYQNVRYYPPNMNVSVIADEFKKGLNVLTTPGGSVLPAISSNP